MSATRKDTERVAAELQLSHSNQRPHDQLMQRSSYPKRSQQKVQPVVEWRSVVTASAMSTIGARHPKIDRTIAVTMLRRSARGNPTNARTGLSTDTTLQRVRRTTTHQHASTSWRFDVVSPWRLDHGTLVPLRRKTVGGSTARDTSHRYEV